MKKSFKNLVAVALIGSSSIAFTGCFGSFTLTQKLYDWNSQVSQNKFVNEIVFLGLCILPAYELATLGDVLIFNSVEFWDGANPLAMEEGEVEKTHKVYAGESFTLTKSLNKVAVTNDKSGVVTSFQYFPQEESWFLMNGTEKVKALKKAKHILKEAI